MVSPLGFDPALSCSPEVVLARGAGASKCLRYALIVDDEQVADPSRQDEYPAQKTNVRGV